MQIDTNSSVAVIGAGTMGTGIAYVAAMAGRRVVLIDGQTAALDRSENLVRKLLDQQMRKQTIDAAAAEMVAVRITRTTDLSQAAGAALAIEAVVEDMAVKTELFRALENVMPAGAVIASNTSSLSITALGSQLRDPGRFIGLHFFNPVPAMKLVEVIAAPATDPGLSASLSELMKQWGKVPVEVRDVPGFIVNRVARPYYAEGFVAWSEGVEPCLIDRLLERGGAFRMGPLALADMIGHDVNYAVACSVFEAYGGKTRFRPNDWQKALVEGNRLGRKSSAGVYDYPEALPEPTPIAPAPLNGSIIASSDAGDIEALVIRLSDASVAVERRDDCPPGQITYNDTRIAVGDGRQLSQRDDCEAILDCPRNWATATATGVTACTPAAEEAAADLLSAAGIAAYTVPDRAGQIVLRTLAQLANAAFDGVADGVASQQAIETAMQLGANHPEGPLAWAQRFGTKRLGAVLHHIHQATGDPMYAPSEALAEALA